MKQFEIIRQRDLKDCGAAALLSIIRHYGGNISLEKLRIDTNTSLEGTNAYNLVKAAKEYGFDSYGMYLDNIKDLDNLVLPAILHVEINHLPHFVVLYKISNNKLEIMDPAKGKIKMAKDNLKDIWSGNVILFYPKYSLPKNQPINFFKTFLNRIFKEEKLYIIYIIFFTIIFTFGTIFTSFYFKVGVNFLNENNEYNVILFISFLFVLFYSFKLAVYYLKNYFQMVLNKNIDGFLYYDFLKQLFLLPNYFLKNRTTGEIMVRLSELSNFKVFFSDFITTLGLDSILAIAVGIILYFINQKLFFILCFISFWYLCLGFISGKILYRRALETNEKEIHFQSQVVENLDAIIPLKNLNVLKNSWQNLEIKLFKFLSENFHLNKVILNINVLSFILEEMLQFLIITVGLIEILNTNITFIDLVIFEGLIGYFLNPFKKLIQVIPNYNFVKVNLDKINDFFNIKIEDEKKGFNNFKPGDIVIKNFNFNYNDFQPILKKLNLKIKENSFVLLKGKSGCGKSTLCQIISRLIDIKDNKIKIGKVNINDYSLEAIRKNITYVGQKECLIQDTIKNNILFYRNTNEELFKEITDICDIEDIITKKPLRYETYLLKDSLNISGGEKQRIILARALLNEFEILILDEALSEVNKDLEISIIKKIKEFFKDKTIIYVSHKNYDDLFDTVIDFEALNE